MILRKLQNNIDLWLYSSKMINDYESGKTRIWKREKEGSEEIGETNAWDACFVLSGIHMGLNTGWQSVWCFPIFHYQAASLAAGHYLLMTEWTADLMDRWMGSLMNVWQVLCQSGRQSKAQGEGRNHLDSRDTFNVSYTTQNPTSLNPHPPTHLAIKLQRYTWY